MSDDFDMVAAMVRGAAAEPELIDGRRARRERNRASVIDAVFEILQEGRVPPPIDEVATRAGVSASTIFRYFDGLEDMQHQAFLRFRERFGHLLQISSIADSPLADRVIAFVDARSELYESAGAIMALGRLRALDHAPLAAAADEQRSALAAQVRICFAPEVDAMTPARRADLVALIDTLASPDSWDVMRRTHERTPRQIRRTWIHAIDELLAGTEAPS